MYNLAVFLYASDWTTPRNLEWLETNGFQNSGKLIKIFAAETDPSEILKRQISTAQESSEPFIEGYKYQSHGPWLPSDMEFYIEHYCRGDVQAMRKARALFRFANKQELGIIDLAMSIKNKETGQRHYSHPLKIIDGLEEVHDRGRTHGLHLDIFTPRSLDRVSQILNLNDPSNLATKREVIQVNREKEIPAVSRERI